MKLNPKKINLRIKTPEYKLVKPNESEMIKLEVLSNVKYFNINSINFTLLTNNLIW